ncbi:MAG: hypothetical protein LBS87_03105 [Puniceicoccales bacterium]|nr:hypothetical protein [Puniceicoccales bacterium]
MSTIFANAKINLSLAVTGRRSDGYHDLLSLNVPASLCDKITVCEAEKDTFKTNNAALLSDNIIGKVTKYLKRYVGKNFSIELEKNIPIMSGFGGGSSDAATVLKFFNERYGLDFSEEKLRNIALLFGADCPFFIKNRPAIVSGTGEKISEIGGNFHKNLAKYHILLFKPNFGVSTKEAYRKLQSKPALYMPKTQAIVLLDQLISSVNNFEPNLPLFNTFSTIVFDERRELASLHGALPCPMMLSGSGSGCFCAFQDSDLETEITRIIKSNLGGDVFIKKCNIP